MNGGFGGPGRPGDPVSCRAEFHVMRQRSIVAAVLAAGAVAVCVAQVPAAPRASTYFDSARLLLDLKTLSADDMQGRQVDTPGGAKARAFVEARFKEIGITPLGGQSFEEPFTFTQNGRGGATPAERHGINVVGTIAGTQSPETFIVVSAHYDHLGMRNGEVMNGADDNASGTAALFSVAKYFSTHAPKHSILFTAFDGEESGEQGSKAFVASPPVPAAKIAIDLNMDMIGRDPDPKLFVVGTFTQPFLKPFVDQIAAKAPITVLIGHDDPAQKNVENWTNQSDHASFMRAKIPALYFGVEDFDHYHKPIDDYESMSFDFYIGAVETMIQAAQLFDARLDELPARTGGTR
jgi:hypothetical protein